MKVYCVEIGLGLDAGNGTAFWRLDVSPALVGRENVGILLGWALYTVSRVPLCWALYTGSRVPLLGPLHSQ